MKSLFLGILLIILLGFGGLVYRNAVEYPLRQVACPLDAKVCPDGTSIARTGSSCTFSECLPPNISLRSVGVLLAVPEGFVATELPDADSVAAYQMAGAISSTSASIIIRRYPIAASSTALATIKKTAIDTVSGKPIPITAYSSIVLGAHRFTVVSMERSDGVAVTAYYFARSTDVLRFDAIDRGVTDLTNPSVDLSTLPAHAGIRKLLATIQAISAEETE